MNWYKKSDINGAYTHQMSIGGVNINVKYTENENGMQISEVISNGNILPLISPDAHQNILNNIQSGINDNYDSMAQDNDMSNNADRYILEDKYEKAIGKF